jgi:hypothetical protein
MTAEDDGQITAALKFHYDAKMVVDPIWVSYLTAVPQMRDRAVGG